MANKIKLINLLRLAYENGESVGIVKGCGGNPNKDFGAFRCQKKIKKKIDELLDEGQKDEGSSANDINTVLTTMPFHGAKYVQVLSLLHYIHCKHHRY